MPGALDERAGRGRLCCPGRIRTAGRWGRASAASSVELSHDPMAIPVQLLRHGPACTDCYVPIALFPTSLSHLAGSSRAQLVGQSVLRCLRGRSYLTEPATASLELEVDTGESGTAVPAPADYVSSSSYRPPASSNRPPAQPTFVCLASTSSAASRSVAAVGDTQEGREPRSLC